MENKFYEPQYLYDHSYKIPLTEIQREGKEITHTFVTESLTWTTVLKEFKTGKEFSDYVFDVYGKDIKEIYICWCFLNEENTLISIPYNPFETEESEDVSNYDFIGEFYCFVHEPDL